MCFVNFCTVVIIIIMLQWPCNCHFCHSLLLICCRKKTEVSFRMLPHVLPARPRTNELHWLSVPHRVKIKLGTMKFRCLRHSVPRYLSDFCTPVANVAARSQLQSARHHLVVVPCYNRSMYGRRAFSVAGLMTWNSLTDSLHDPSLSIDSFRRHIKTFLFSN